MFQAHALHGLLQSVPFKAQQGQMGELKSQKLQKRACEQRCGRLESILSLEWCVDWHEKVGKR